jgi:hypothetical protein
LGPQAAFFQWLKPGIPPIQKLVQKLSQTRFPGSCRVGVLAHHFSLRVLGAFAVNLFLPRRHQGREEECVERWASTPTLHALDTKRITIPDGRPIENPPRHGYKRMVFGGSVHLQNL